MSEQLNPTVPVLEKVKCGVIMPIASIDNCSPSHWAEVLEIIKQSLDGTPFYAELVSSSADTAIIHKTIVKNVYDNEIIICDVSARNPNVMLELGMRLAFDKAVVVIKDDATPYSFDSSPIEHLDYPRDLRFGKIQAFKTELRKKVLATHAASQKTSSFFLKDYPLFKTAALPEKEASQMQVVLAEMNEIKSAIRSLSAPPNDEGKLRTNVFIVPSRDAEEIIEGIREEGRIATILNSGNKKSSIAVTRFPGESIEAFKTHVEKVISDIVIPF